MSKKDVLQQESPLKTRKELEEWLIRLETPYRAGSIFDNHVELGMMYVLRKLLGKDIKDLEKQSLKWRNQIFKANYDRIDISNFKKGLVTKLRDKEKELNKECKNPENINYDKMHINGQQVNLRWVLGLLKTND